MTQIASIARAGTAKSETSKVKESAGKTISAAAIRWLLPVAAVALMTFFGMKSSVFFTYGNLMAVATQNAPTFIVAAIFALLLMAGYVDLSIGSLMALVGVCCNRRRIWCEQRTSDWSPRLIADCCDARWSGCGTGARAIHRARRRF
jgi:ABC-type xylose transport system permease subunit